MAVINSGENTFQINNGDLEALRRIKNAYHLREDIGVIIFALGVLSQANGKALSFQKDDGSIVRLLPADELKNNA